MSDGPRGRMEVFRFGEGSDITWNVPKTPELTPNTPEPGSLSVSPSNPPALGSLQDIFTTVREVPEQKRRANLTQSPTSHADPNHNELPQVKPLRMAREAQQWPSSSVFTLQAVSHRVLPGTRWPLSVTSEWSAHLPAWLRILDIPNHLSHDSFACSWLPFNWPTFDEHLLWNN